MQVIDRKWINWIILCGLLFQGCIYDYNPDLNKYEDLVVVCGVITNNYGPHIITINRTESVYGYSSKPENNATVSITDDEGNSVPLTEKGNGQYLTPDNFKGTIGNRYRLLITLDNGKQYMSDFVELIDVPEIKSIEYHYSSKINPKTNDEVFGYQFYVSSDGNNGESTFFRWEMIETWEIRMPYSITHYWTGDSLMQVSYPSRCWKYGKVDDIYIATTQEYQTNSINKLPILFTSVETDRLSIKYRLTVNQYALTEASYYFWKGQVENTQQQGSLYNKQPYQVIGNMVNIDNPDEIVLGIFEASAVSSMDIYVKPPDYDVPTGFETCESVQYGQLTELERKRPYYASFTITDSIVVFNRKCADCTSSGATPNEPLYWDDNNN